MAAFPLRLLGPSLLPLLLLRAGTPTVGATEAGKKEQAEAALVAEIRRQYGIALGHWEQRQYGEAKKAFEESQALYQAARPHLSQPVNLEPVRRGCDEYLAALRALDRQAAAIGGWREKLLAVEVPQFAVRDAEVGPVLELLRRRCGELTGKEPPSFTLAVPASMLQRRISLETGRMPLLKIIEAVAEMGQMEVRFERYSVRFSPAAQSRGAQP